MRKYISNKTWKYKADINISYPVPTPETLIKFLVPLVGSNSHNGGCELSCHKPVCDPNDNNTNYCFHG